MIQYQKNIKFTFIWLMFVLVSDDSQAQNFSWAARIGGAFNDEARSVTTDLSGNIYVTGDFEGTVDFDPGLGTYNMTSNLTGMDVYISKFDPSGNFIWAKQINGSGSFDFSKSIAVDASGNVYITGGFGVTADFDPGPGSFILTASGSTDIFISKLDSSGNFIWARHIGATASNYGNAIAADNSGNIFLTGVLFGTVDFDPGVGTGYLTSSGQIDIFITKFDAAGNFIWAKQIGGTYDDFGNALITDPSGNVYTTGAFAGTADFDPGAGTFQMSATGSSSGKDVFFVKLDASGNFLFAKQIGGPNNDYAMDISLDAAGNLYATGYFADTADFDPGVGTYNLITHGNRDIFIYKSDALGNFIWAKQIGGHAIDEGRSISVNDSGSVILTGSFQDTVDFDPGTGTHFLTSVSNHDIFILKSDSSGQFLWSRQIGGLNTVVVNDVITDAPGNIYAAGKFSASVDFDPGQQTFNLTSSGGDDIFIIKLNSVPTTADEIEDVNQVKLFPNPCSGKFTIDLQKNCNRLQVSLKNIIGQQILSENYSSTNSIDFDLKNAASGIYFVEIKMDDEKPVMMKIIRE